MKTTDLLIRDAFWQLLGEKPYNKITVKDIVELCHVNRNTFYYHYSDIRELLEKTFTIWANEIIFSHKSKRALRETLESLVNSFLDNKKEILNIYKNMDREVFIREIKKLCTYIIDIYVSEATLNVADISDEEVRMLKGLYKCTILGILLDWLDSDMEYDLFSYIVHIRELFDEKGLIVVID